MFTQAAIAEAQRRSLSQRSKSVVYIY